MCVVAQIAALLLFASSFGMAPKLAPAEKCLRTKRAGALLESQMLADQLTEQKKTTKIEFEGSGTISKKGLATSSCCEGQSQQNRHERVDANHCDEGIFV